MSASSQPNIRLSGAGDDDTELLVDQNTVLRGAENSPRPDQSPRQSTSNRISSVLAKRQAIVLRVLAGFSSEPTLEGGLLAAADAIKMCFCGVRVSFGHCHNERITLAAVSQQANVDLLTEESELICAVMLEALDKDQVVVTTQQTLSMQGMQSHRLLCAGRPDRQVVTLPLFYMDECVAALCFERDSQMPMVTSTIELIRQIAVLLAPMIVARKLAERSVSEHAKNNAAKCLNLITEPRYVKLKAIALLLLTGLLFGSFWQTTDWVKASAELVPLERRVIAAPHKGYVHSVERGSGEPVVAGDVLLRMNTNEAELEKARWQSELDGLGTDMRAAMASADRRQMAILTAEIEKARAQLSLVETQLSRADIIAPVDGVVVSGDLSQMVGAPVSRGQLLLELAPEKGYEVHLLVDGDKINRVQVGDLAQLRLQVLSSSTLSLVIERIHPIGVAEGGANRFRVIARIVSNTQSLKPGQTGIGKINVGKASVLQVLTGDFVAWLFLKKWEWLG